MRGYGACQRSNVESIKCHFYKWTHYTIITHSAHLTQMRLLAFRMGFICCAAAGLSPEAVRLWHSHWRWGLWCWRGELAHLSQRQKHNGMSTKCERTDSGVFMVFVYYKARAKLALFNSPLVPALALTPSERASSYSHPLTQPGCKFHTKN